VAGTHGSMPDIRLKKKGDSRSEILAIQQPALNAYWLTRK
jgi:hypothetical protein